MHKRTRDMTTMVEVAALTLIRTYQAKARLCADVRAPNGVEMTFSLSTGSRSDVRGDLNEQAKMKRFARLNPAASQSPEQIAQREADLVALPAPAVVHKPRRRLAPVTTPVRRAITPPAPPITTSTITMSKAPTTNVVEDFTPRQFYLLCEWLKAQKLPLIPSFDALAMLASQHFGMPASEATIKEAIALTELVEPEHWAPPTEPHQILAQEMVTFMRSLGAEPSAAVISLLKHVAVSA